ncbi:MAG: hypothetical protein M3203_14155, partial [Actinomycetota bacterium]|nr:hypothetical protein [Actinomycetota bacterium]
PTTPPPVPSGSAGDGTATGVPAPADATAPSPGPDVSPYLGLGAWVDAFDYAPAYYRPREGRQVVPEDLHAMAAQGVQTLYLQAARRDEKSPEGIVDAALVGRFLSTAHAAGMRVVAWYLPKFGDVEADLANLLRLRDFRADGRRFDGIAVDIEYRSEVPDAGELNRRVIELSRRLRAAAPDRPLGAIVYPPVHFEVTRPAFWPGFPWADLADAYDVWLPMAYWTEVPAGSAYRDAYRYVHEGTRRLREVLGDPAAPVHVIGGVADTATVGDLAGFVRGVGQVGAVGWSLYDYRTTTDAGWEALRQVALPERR